MYLTFLISQLIIAAVANPLHKYPYVFLLDVGNEEIENTVTEQLRVSIPGSSVALKYPATADGDPIAHVRVSGIDFGTDLKANIVEGGPGYNYVILAFMGNPGVTYDAVITIETLANEGNTPQNRPIEPNNDNVRNDSAEDITDDSDSKVYYQNSNNKLIESNNNIYKYDNEAVVEKNYRDYQDDNDSSNEIDEDENDENQDYPESNNIHEVPESSDNTIRNNVNNEKYAKYEGFRPQLYGGARIYPQAALYIDDDNYARPVYDPEKHDDAPTYEGSVNSDESNGPNNNVRRDNSLVVE